MMILSKLNLIKKENLLKNHSLQMIANTITLSRIFVLPFLIVSEIQGHSIRSLIIICLMCLSDIMDGMVARSSGEIGKYGKFLDVTADFIVILSVFLLWYFKSHFPIYIIALLLFSFFSFILLSLLKKKMVKNKIGQYTGTVCFAGIVIIVFSRIFYFGWIAEIKNIMYLIISCILIMSIIENIFKIIIRSKNFITDYYSQSINRRS